MSYMRTEDRFDYSVQFVTLFMMVLFSAAAGEGYKAGHVSQTDASVFVVIMSFVLFNVGWYSRYNRQQRVIRRRKLDEDYRRQVNP